MATLVALVGLLVWGQSLHAQADFYKGKTITVIAGTTPGALYDQWARLLAQHMGKHIPGKPDMVVQNMPGAGHMIAANYVYNKSKPDGLTIIGSIVPSLYFDQLVGRKEAQYDWAKFVWIGSPVQGESQMYMRADTPYKTIEDVRNAKEPPRCGAQGTSDSAYYLPKLVRRSDRHEIQSRAGLSGRSGDRSGRGTRRDPLPRVYHRSVFVARAVSHLAQEGLCPQHHPNRQEARQQAAGNADNLGADG